MKLALRFIIVAVISFTAANQLPAPVTGGPPDQNEVVYRKDGGASLIQERDGRRGWTSRGGVWHWLSDGTAQKTKKGYWVEVSSPTPKSKTTSTSSQPSDNPKAARAKPTPVESAAPAEQFVGTWINETSHRVINGIEVSGYYTIEIKADGTAEKKLGVYDDLHPPYAFRRIYRSWKCSSPSVLKSGSTITIEWSRGELTSWEPKTISRDEIESYGSPSPETSVYRLKGDKLTRINVPDGVSYSRVK